MESEWNFSSLCDSLSDDDEKSIFHHKIDNAMHDSLNPSRQVQAISLLPRLLGKHADPMMVNTVLLKLAELFHKGSR